MPFSTDLNYSFDIEIKLTVTFLYIQNVHDVSSKTVTVAFNWDYKNCPPRRFMHSNLGSQKN